MGKVRILCVIVFKPWFPAAPKGNEGCSVRILCGIILELWRRRIDVAVLRLHRRRNRRYCLGDFRAVFSRQGGGTPPQGRRKRQACAVGKTEGGAASAERRDGGGRAA